MHVKSLLVSAFALIAIVAGCGGGDDSSEETDTTISASSIGKAAFVKQANAICRPTKAKLLSAVVAYQRENLNQVSEKLVPRTARKIIRPQVEAQIEEIQALGAPAGDSAEIEAFFAALVDGIDEIVRRKVTTYAEAEDMLRDAVGLARRYGLDDCEYDLVDDRFNTRVLNSN